MSPFPLTSPSLTPEPGVGTDCLPSELAEPGVLAVPIVGPTLPCARCARGVGAHPSIALTSARSAAPELSSVRGDSRVDSTPATASPAPKASSCLVSLFRIAACSFAAALPLPMNRSWFITAPPAGPVPPAVALVAM